MFDTLFYWIIVPGLIAFVIMMLAYKYRHYQDQLLYYPEMPPGSSQHCDSPSDYGIERFERVSIQTADGITIRGFMMRPSTTGDPSCLIVYFHGNAGNVGQRLPIARMFIRNLRAAVLMVDYRGYGLSDKAAPNEEGLEADVQATLDWAVVQSKVPAENIFLMGTSLGGAVVTYLASRPKNNRKYAGIIVENSFTSISDMVDVIGAPIIKQTFPRGHKCLIPFLTNILKPLVLFIGWNSKSRMQAIEAPALFLSSAQDELVPAWQHQALHDGCKSRIKEFVSFANGHHNDACSQQGYCEAIGNFVRTVLTSPPPPTSRSTGTPDVV